MAKTSKINRNEHRKQMVAKYASRRLELKEIIRSPSSSDAERFEAVKKLAKLPRDASPTRVRNRCALTGRPRGYYRKFGLSRIALRENALAGLLPGVTKSSW
ncbi:MAG: 30S ribosomal protein S14 [Myxococcota bacterium]|nr:30S ribosomal protein S14 [Myxococcota bacterium]